MTRVITVSRRSAAIDQILLVLVPFAAWLALSNQVFLFVFGDRVPDGVGPFLHVTITAMLAGGLMAAALASEPDRLRALGLAPMGARSAVGWGLFAAAASYLANSAAALVYFLVTRRSVEEELASKAQWTSRLAQIPLAWIVPLAVVVGVYEEVLFRGFFLGRLRALVRGGALGARAEVAIAVLVSSALFAAGHTYQGAIGVVQTFTMGVVLGLVAVRCRAAWPCIIAHVIIDTLGLFVLHGLLPAIARPP